MSLLRDGLAGVRVYGNRRVLTVLWLGFSSGLPLALTFQTLSVWLSEAGVSKTAIGLLALLGIPYTCKFLWAPLIDRLPLPYLTARLGRRRSWALLTQLALMLTMLALGATDPARAPAWTALCAFLVAFCSASQDIVLDAYRVESLAEHQYGAGAAMMVFGYRLGMVASSAGALYLATALGWFLTYACMAALMLVGIVTVLWNPEPANTIPPSPGAAELRHWLYSAVVQPFADFMRRRNWLLILLFILLYKCGDALASVMSNPFYLALGFTKIDIANLGKLLGLVATLSGGFLGGILVSRVRIVPSLLICGVLQMLSNLMFVVQAMAGHHYLLLAVTITVENVSGGMGTAAFIAYLSSLCNVAYTATQYALLSSLMAFGRLLMASSSGWMADHLGWVSFFLLTTVAALPGLAVLLWMRQSFPAPSVLTEASPPGLNPSQD
jgi:PAT family beta-lactamase induction signal transducer AmpG